MKAGIQHHLNAQYLQVSYVKLRHWWREETVQQKEKYLTDTDKAMEIVPPSLNNFPWCQNHLFSCRSQVDTLYCQKQGEDNDPI